jgi:CubicO group peptidase (beta-lactamase class C family)
VQLRPGTAQEAGLSAERVAHVADLAANWVAWGLTPALAVLVARRGIVVQHEAFGRLTPAADAPPLARDTIFPVASVTKPITATAIMMLVEDGLLSLNRPVAEYIPEFVGEGKEAVMVHHLLTHTSGLLENEVWPYIDKRSQAGVQIPPPAETHHPKLNEYLFLGYDAPLWKSPGVEMSYCSYGYDLLGEIVRRVSGKALADFARDRIFEPLGMKDTWYSVPESLAHRVVQRPPSALFAELDSPIMVDLPPFIKSLLGGLNSRELQELPYAGGGVYSTVMDMAIFGQMFLNRGHYGDTQLLSPSTVAVMTRNQIPGLSAFFDNEFFPEASWGFGWDVRGDKKPRYEGTLCSPATFSHGGMGGIFLWVDPLYEMVGVYFSVVLCTTADGQQPDWLLDLFQNAVTATIRED